MNKGQSNISMEWWDTLQDKHAKRMLLIKEIFTGIRAGLYGDKEVKRFLLDETCEYVPLTIREKKAILKASNQD